MNGEVLNDKEAFAYAFGQFAKVVTLKESDKEAFRSLFKVVRLRRKELLIREGQVCKGDYYIVQGCLRSYYVDKDQIEHTTRLAVEGWWSGNLKSFLRQVPSEFNVVALEDTMVLKVDRADIEKLYQRAPVFERYFRILLQNSLLSTQDRVSQHLSSSALDKYRQFRKRYPTLEQRVSQKDIASYLGITPAYLSRLRKNYR